ncbi:FAD-dependent oxidoreductase [Geovibrio thiophilus]|uniref:FAD-dependent oxidoreductase n=2 Tax=Geovibrio thiophilus TaxID=139438 RepID=A0A3R5XZG7_9BACT|nr:FAD-dependent oxidoreductase [Geovibrio thiophilus]
MAEKKGGLGSKMLTKRDFMKVSGLTVGAAILAVGGASTSLATTGSVSVKKWDYEADVIVIGTGPAGLSCAAAAAESGASVIAIDANNKIGGKGILSGGNLGIGGGTRMQKDLGYVETADIIYEDRTVPNLRTDATMKVDTVDNRKVTMGMWRKISGAEDGEGMARAFADNSLDTWNWLDKMGCAFIKANVSKMSQVYRGSRYFTTTAQTLVDRDNGKPGDLTSGGAGIIWPLYDKAEEGGVEFMLSCKMTKIIREDNGGRVVGIEATYNGKTIYMKGKKAVFLGTGSWNGNDNLKQLFLPWLTRYPHITGEPYVKNDGKGIEAAIAIGASLSTDRGSDWHGWHRHPGSLWHRSGAPFGISGFEDGFLDSESIYVNAEGNRFMNEEIGEDNPAWVGGSKPFYFAQICATQTTDKDGPVVWIIMDETSRMKQKLEFKPGENVETFMYGKGNTLEELASAIKVPGANLAASVKRYNELVAKGKDEDFGKQEITAQIIKPPFHAIKWGIQKHNTLGGVTINPKARVLDWNRKPIPGLYAAGESAGAMDLIGLARPIVFGRIAGLTIAKEEK